MIRREVCKLGLFRSSWIGLNRAMPFAQNFAVDPWSAEDTRIIAEMLADADLITNRRLKLTQSLRLTAQRCLLEHGTTRC